MSSSSSAATAPKYIVGDLVWAKMKGFSPWPGKVSDPATTKLKKPAGNYRYKTVHCIYFFGSNNFAWIPEDSLKPFEEFKEANSKSCKSSSFKDALAKIEKYIKTGTLDELLQLEKDISEDSGDKSDRLMKSPEKEPKPSTPKTPSSTQRNYSRTPFNSKNKKSLSATPSDDEVSVPKKSRSSMSASSNEEVIPPSSSNGHTTSSHSSASKSPAKVGARNLLARTSAYLFDSGNEINNSQSELDVGAVSAKSKTIKASTLKFGFIGLGFMGARLVKNLINSGHQVTIWNRTPGKCKDFIVAGATKATTPADVISASDITFSCLSDPAAVKEIVFGNCGVLTDIRAGKGYVEISNLDPGTSNDISEAIITRGGRYLEGSIIANGKQQAEDGALTIVLAGDKSLFEDCDSCFQAIASHTFYLGGSIGDASKMGLVISMLVGNLIGSLAESMALADRTGLNQKDLLEIFSLSSLNCPTLLSKGKAMIEGSFPAEMQLTLMQKDLRLALQLAEEFEHPLPITASTNEVFKHAKHLGYSEHDVAAVYIRSRF